MNYGSRISHTLEVRVPGKAILAGEHFVLYGVEAIAAPLPARVLCLRLAYRPGVELVLPEPFYGLSAAVSAVLEERMAGFIRLSCTSEIPQGAGLGSSAAFAVALGRALVLATDEENLKRSAPHHGALNTIDNERKALQIAHLVENKIHGSASGIDAAAVSSPGAIRYSMEPERVRALKVARPLRFVLLDTGVRRSTREQIELVAQRRKGNSELFQALAERARAQVSTFIRGMEVGDKSAVWSAVEGLGAILSDLGLEPEHAKDLRQEFSSMGLALKVTGAGGGGYLLGFAEDERVLDEVVASAGGKGHAFDFSVPSCPGPSL